MGTIEQMLVATARERKAKLLRMPLPNDPAYLLLVAKALDMYDQIIDEFGDDE